MLASSARCLISSRVGARTQHGCSFRGFTGSSGLPVSQRLHFMYVDPSPKRFLSVIKSAETAAQGTAEATKEEPDVSKLDIRVGTILAAEDHPEADTLYVETIDLGEEEGPRTIVSGLKKYTTPGELQGKKVLVLANLKARNMRGIKSHGMLLCASNEEHTEVEPLEAPEGAANGERVAFPTPDAPDDEEQGEPALPNQLQKKKFWESCQPLLKTDAQGLAMFNGRPMMTASGQVKALSLCSANIS